MAVTGPLNARSLNTTPLNAGPFEQLAGAVNVVATATASIAAINDLAGSVVVNVTGSATIVLQRIFSGEVNTSVTAEATLTVYHQLSGVADVVVNAVADMQWSEIPDAPKFRTFSVGRETRQR